ncbi:MAG: STAS domain-containing protein [Cyanobacteria bacterium P01_A01_bin.84]
MQTTLIHEQNIVITPQGHINAANALEFERDLTTALVRKENYNLLVNLEKVESLDSAGLMALVSALKLAQGLNKNLNICRINPSVKIIFELTQLDRVFQVCEN